MLRVIAAALVLWAGAAWGQTVPETQTLLSTMFHDAAVRFDAADGNEISQARIVASLNSGLCAKMAYRQARGWLGKVQEVGLTFDGYATVLLQAGPSMTVETPMLSLFDRDKMVQPHTPLFEAVAGLRRGDIVMFTGDLTGVSESAGCLLNLRLTTSGQLHDPALRIKLIALLPVGR